MKFKALPYTDIAVSNNEYRDFLLQEFGVGNLYSFNKEDPNPFFVDWRGTDMKGWYKLVNPHCGVKLEFFADEYKLHMPKKVYVFPYPITINEFISDCKRVGLTLYWNTVELDKIFQLRIYLPEEDSKIYYKELLTKIRIILL